MGGPDWGGLTVAGGPRQVYGRSGKRATMRDAESCLQLAGRKGGITAWKAMARHVPGEFFSCADQTGRLLISCDTSSEKTGRAEADEGMTLR